MMINKYALFTIILIFIQQITLAQLAIGKPTVDGDALIDFPNDVLNGIVLPHIYDVETAKVNEPGTIVFEKKSNKFKYYDGTQWITINRTEGDSSQTTSTPDNHVDQGVIIGSDSSNAKGVLILESSNKALVLPKVSNPSKNIPSPYPGMICYDLISDNVYFFNGLVWEFWGT